ncbi:hypothetical protein DE146DRAFT_754368 [Phaeosphaeria sp. MPI-PUGE-AT-0046c]|nr:hypothetical protein DE146DRAFT_754368 [Phaeosphaeria sp. MPI-PUGE-AT-0046c]
MAKAYMCAYPDLTTLHYTGGIRPLACGYEESVTIHLYYNDLCEKPVSDHTSLSPSTAIVPPPTPSSVPGRPTYTTDPLSPSPTPAEVEGKAENPGTWVSAHSKYLIVAGAMLGVTPLLLHAFLLHRRHQKAELERAHQANGMIPLQLRSRPQTPGNVSPPISSENLAATVPSSPLVESPSAYSFGDTLRGWEQEFLEMDQNLARRDDPRVRVARHLAGRDRAT